MVIKWYHVCFLTAVSHVALRIELPLKFVLRRILFQRYMVGKQQPPEIRACNNWKKHAKGWVSLVPHNRISFFAISFHAPFIFPFDCFAPKPSWSHFLHILSGHPCVSLGGLSKEVSYALICACVLVIHSWTKQGIYQNVEERGEREVIIYPSLVDYVVITPFFVDSHHARTYRVIYRHAAQFVVIARHELRGLMSEPEELATYSIHQISDINWC